MVHVIHTYPLIGELGLPGLVALLVPAAFVGLAVYATWRMSREAVPVAASESAFLTQPERLLAERLARGEITVDEYERVLSVLRS
jgi:uncharacterized membrane protein